jgi:hypothetical protein
MKFLTAISVLVLAFVTIVDGAMAAPFTVGQAVVTPPASTSVPSGSTCNNYNDYVSNPGAPLNGNHAGYCQFSSAQIMLNGTPFDKFWQDISKGPSQGGTLPPYDVIYSFGPDGLCATAKNLKIEVSIQVQTSRLDWPGAASVGQACLNEWNRHSPASLVSTPTQAAALSAVQRMVNYLNLPLRRHPTIQACVSGRLASNTQAFADLEKKIKNFMRPWVMWAQYSLSAEASGDECKLHCRVCSSGWAGTITLTKKYSGTTFTATDQYYVGGASSVPTHIPADWTSDGPQGSWPAGGFTWTLHAAAAGQCDPMGNAVCIETLISGNNTTFREANSSFSIPNTYIYSQNGQPQQPRAASETQIQTIVPNIQTTSATAEGQNPNTACLTGPPSFPLSNGCTQLWEWHLFKQP